MEEWKPIPGYEMAYEVSDRGRVRSRNRVVAYSVNGKAKTMRKKSKILSQEETPDGYLRVSLSSHGRMTHFSVHRLVGVAFIPNPKNLPEVAHLDHVRMNNIPQNLKWASRNGNHSDSVIENRYALAGPNIGRKRTFSAEEIRSIRARFAIGERQSDISRSLGIRQEQVRKIVRRERWDHIK